MEYRTRSLGNEQRLWEVVIKAMFPLQARRRHDDRISSRVCGRHTMCYQQGVNIDWIIRDAVSSYRVKYRDVLSKYPNVQVKFSVSDIRLT